jgi:hypothetical protein
MSESFYELAVSEDEAAEELAAIAVRVAEALNEIVEVFGVDAIDWIRAELERRTPVVHVTSWWQRPLGRLGIATRALCGERIVARTVPGPMRQCRECQRDADWLVEQFPQGLERFVQRLSEDKR